MVKKDFIPGYTFQYQLRPNWRDHYWIDITVKNKSASIYWRDEFKDHPTRFLAKG